MKLICELELRLVCKLQLIRKLCPQAESKRVLSVMHDGPCAWAKPRNICGPSRTKVAPAATLMACMKHRMVPVRCPEH